MHASLCIPVWCLGFINSTQLKNNPFAASHVGMLYASKQKYTTKIFLLYSALAYTWKFMENTQFEGAFFFCSENVLLH